MAFAVRIRQNYKLIPEKSLVCLAVSQYDADTVEFVQSTIVMGTLVPGGGIQWKQGIFTKMRVLVFFYSIPHRAFLDRLHT
jgi:hypothetical protein